MLSPDIFGPPHTSTDHSTHGHQPWCGRHGRHGCPSHGRGQSSSGGTSYCGTTAAATTSTIHHLHLHSHQNTAQAQPFEQPPAGTATAVLGAGVVRNQKTSPVWQHFRSLSRRSGRKRSSAECDHKVTCLGTAPCAQPAARETLHVQPRRPCSGKEKKYVYRPALPRKKTLPSRPVVKNKSIAFYPPCDNSPPVEKRALKIDLTSAQ